MVITEEMWNMLMPGTRRMMEEAGIKTTEQLQAEVDRMNAMVDIGFLVNKPEPAK